MISRKIDHAIRRSQFSAVKNSILRTAPTFGTTIGFWISGNQLVLQHSTQCTMTLALIRTAIVAFPRGRDVVPFKARQVLFWF